MKRIQNRKINTHQAQVTCDKHIILDLQTILNIHTRPVLNILWLNPRLYQAL